MGPDDSTGADVERRGLQLRKKLCGKNDRVAAAPLKDRQNDRRVGRVKRVDKIADEISADKRMVHKAEQHALEIGGQGFWSCLDGRELAPFPIGVDYPFRRGQMDGLCYWFGVKAPH